MFLYTAYWLLDKPFLPILYHKIGTLTKICYDTKNNPVTTRLFCHILFIKWFTKESKEDTRYHSTNQDEEKVEKGI